MMTLAVVWTSLRFHEPVLMGAVLLTVPFDALLALTTLEWFVPST
jgi:hypothetical protein